MAIFGVGSNWSGEELKNRFFDESKFILGWNEESAKDLYSFVASLKVGDILYIKANQPGSRTIRVKGVGIVTKNLLTCMSSGELVHSAISDWQTLFVEVAWIRRDEFQINIPDNEGKLTNTRAATLYEEYLPYVQEAIVASLIPVSGASKYESDIKGPAVEMKGGKVMHLTFEEDEKEITAVSLAAYLFLFHFVYQAVETQNRHDETSDHDEEHYKAIWEKLPHETLLESIEPFEFRYHQASWPFIWPFLYEPIPGWETRLSEDTLQIRVINKSSPLIMTLCGIGTALAVAVIISGGTINFSLTGVKCKLPPIGKGIEALRKALRKKSQKKGD